MGENALIEEPRFTAERENTMKFCCKPPDSVWSFPKPSTMTDKKTNQFEGGTGQLL